MTIENSPIEAEIRALEDRRYNAVIRGDFDTLESLFHIQLVYTHSRGDRDTLASYLTKLRQGFYKYHRIEHPIDNILLVGDTAIVVGEMNAELSVNGTAKTLTNNVIAVWTKDSGTWKLLAYQPTPRS
ncbi:conserved hypothetical protein [Arthrobacter sp. 9V]|uniref:nuclear transport factor 2 family protein n=1 Tax=Arthrobacter sp. 9V TaxID=2653132 RepID=UPI0012EF0070|nr:nuclear transport factor 2 family protein [Arthrobacter sp. 9V]VXC42772.1 conserved hypothetical protein [Arthrobacter sp. 9V]